MNYPRMINKHWYKPDNDMRHVEQKAPKETFSLFQPKELTKPVNLRGELGAAFERTDPGPGQFEHLKKPSTRTLTTAPVDYKRQMIADLKNTVINGEELGNVMPISCTVQKPKQPNAAEEYKDLIWNFEEVMKKRIPVDYASESARHYAVSKLVMNRA